MYDAQKVVFGIIIFLALVLSPFWLNVGGTVEPPKPEKPTVEKECVESASWMRANHMQLLDEWRDEVVRGGDREYVNNKGKHFEKSLTLTCLDCHKKKKNFCDRCHTYASVKPYCWQCHVVPKEKI